VSPAWFSADRSLWPRLLVGGRAGCCANARRTLGGMRIAAAEATTAAPDGLDFFT